MLYTMTVGISAFLLFLVQPLIAKSVLPWFGGGASIWITSLVFFQTLLLLGYGMTHYLVRWLGLKRHIMFTAMLLVVSLVFLPLSAHLDLTSSLPPSLHLFIVLLLSAGLPYLVLSTTSPTLQYWMANDNRARFQSPYLQYGVSNLGSLAGLLCYPFGLEIAFTTDGQSWFWSGLYMAYALLMVATIVLFLRHNPAGASIVPTERLRLATHLRVKFVFQAMVPSALLLVVTHYLTIDVVNLPLLWVAPLAVYLSTFIFCFLFPKLSRPGNTRTLLAVMSILLLSALNLRYFETSFTVKIAAGLACLFFVGMIFHGDLERDKPHKQDLTDFYLQVALGGCLGSILVGLVAPLVFETTFEFIIVLVVALYYIVATRFSLALAPKWQLRSAVTLTLILSWFTHERGLANSTIYEARSFYGTYAVREQHSPPTPVRWLVSGTHIHGVQRIDPGNEQVPISYYYGRTGIAELFKEMKPQSVGAIGLGIGVIVEYGNQETSFDFYELDQKVIDIATHYFTLLPEAKSKVKYIVGDGRVQLRNAPDQKYDLLVLDAFTSGSIPTHLVTLQALEEMFRKVKSGGAIAYHISNQHIDLLPVLNAIAHKLGVHLLYQESSGNERLHEFPARWAVLTTNTQLANTLQAKFDWRHAGEKQILWTDGYSNIYSVLK